MNLEQFQRMPAWKQGMLAEQHAMDRAGQYGSLLHDHEGERRDQEQLMLDVLGTATPFGAMTKINRLAKTVLPMDEASRMKRAREMGYTVNAYHGTGGDIAEFDPSKMNPSMKLGKGFYFSETPSYANLASSIRHKRARAKGDESQSANVMPVKLKLENPMVFDSENALPVGGRLDMDTLKAMGHDGVILKSNKGNEITVFEPHQIRSKFAKFDPKKSKSGNILAGAGGTAVALPVLSERE